MSFSLQNGYTPISFDALMDYVREGINSEFGTSYTTQSFVGTGWYRYFYTLVQRMQENEVKMSEIFLKLQEYITSTNLRIQRPSVSSPGLLDSFASAGYVVSVKPPADVDAGKIYICALLDDAADDYEDDKLAVCTLVKDFTAAGLVSQGTEEEIITLSNGQSFSFKFNLPNEIPVLLKLTCTVSENNLLSIPTDTAIRQVVFENIQSRYRLGWNFEPQRYFTLSDAPWAGQVVLEWSSNAGSTWHDTIYDAAYTDLFTFDLEDIDVVFA